MFVLKSMFYDCLRQFLEIKVSFHSISPKVYYFFIIIIIIRDGRHFAKHKTEKGAKREKKQ